MAKINPLSEDVSFVSKLDDEPNDIGGLTAAELKAVFDKAGNVLKQYINDVIVETINNMMAADVVFAPTESITGSTVQAAIEEVNAQIIDIVLGQIPDGSITAEKLAEGVLSDVYNKEESLTDNTKTAYGLPETATPDNVLSAIKKMLDGKATTEDLNGKLGTVFSVGTSEPSDTRLLWIDTTATTGGLKYYNGSAWVTVPVAFYG